MQLPAGAIAFICRSAYGSVLSRVNAGGGWPVLSRHRRGWAARSTVVRRRRASPPVAGVEAGELLLDLGWRHSRGIGGNECQRRRPRADGRRLAGLHRRLQVAGRQPSPAPASRFRTASSASTASASTTSSRFASRRSCTKDERCLVPGFDPAPPDQPGHRARLIVHSPQQSAARSNWADSRRAAASSRSTSTVRVLSPGNGTLDLRLRQLAEPRHRHQQGYLPDRRHRR